MNNYLEENQLSENLKKDMISVEGGTFIMGSNGGESDEKPLHDVTLGSFMMSKYEVTQELWESVMGNNPSNFKGNKRPVEKVSWFDAVEFCNRLSEKEGLQKAYSGSGSSISCDFSSKGYRLPTETEWEFAARGGNQSKGYKYSGSNDIDVVAIYNGNSGSTTHEVGTKRPNELGLFDMSGNVLEWCWDGKGEHTSTSETNPRGPNSGTVRVQRGGSWSFGAKYSHTAYRIDRDAGGSYYSVGLRLVRTKN